MAVDERLVDYQFEGIAPSYIQSVRFTNCKTKQPTLRWLFGFAFFWGRFSNSFAVLSDLISVVAILTILPAYVQISSAILITGPLVSLTSNQHW